MNDTVQLTLQHFSMDLPRVLITGSRQYKRTARVQEWVSCFAKPFMLVGSRRAGVEVAAERAARVRGAQVLVYQECDRWQVWDAADRIVVFWDEVDRDGLGMIREAARLSKLWLAYGASGHRISRQRIAELVGG